MVSNDENWPRDALPEGTYLYGYRIDRVLGRGGFGITYRALDRIEQLFAIKECFPRQFAVRQGMDVLPTDAEAVASLKDCLDRFIREARALLQLSRIDSTGDGVVKVVTSFDTNNTAYIVMEFLGGESLEDLIREYPAGIPQDRLAAILSHLLHAVGCAHEAGLLHRDIKPSNILLRQSGRPVLIDFGAVRSVSSPHTNAFTQIYSEAYAPLEQITGESQGPYSDIYAVGATCYRAIGGTAVNALTRHVALVSGRPDPLVPAAELGAGRYDPRLLHAIDAALKVAVQDRPQTVREFRALLAPAAEDRTIVARPLPRDTAAAPTPRRAAAAATAVVDHVAVPPAPAAVPASPRPAPQARGAPVRKGKAGRLVAFGGLASALAVAGIGFVLWQRAPSAPSSAPADAPLARLDIRTTPAGAALRLDGNPVGTAPLKQKVKPGRHLIEAALDGYQPSSATVTTKPGQSLREDLRLSAIPATVIIGTHPDGATVSVDDQPVGAAPLQKELAPGKHQIQARLEGYQPQSLSIEPRPGQTLREELNLTALPATLSITTAPAGAKVSIDGKPIGAAPLQKQLTPGKHQVQASLDGYQPQSLSVEARPGQTLREELKLSAVAATLIVDSAPPGATIRIDDSPVGATPLQEWVAPGKHQLQATLDGYQPQSLSIEPGAGQTLREELKLAALPATLVVSTAPPGAAVSIDDNPVGAAPLQKQLEPGAHQIRANLEGYQPESRSVSLRAGQTLPVNLELPPAAPTPAFSGLVADVLDPHTLVVAGKGPIYLYGIRIKNLGENQQQADKARQRMQGLFQSDGKSVTCFNGPHSGAAAPGQQTYRCFTKDNIDVAQWAVQHGLAEFDSETSPSRPAGQ
jgi:endonuclease YncB( thermonuclease family)